MPNRGISGKCKEINVNQNCTKADLIKIYKNLGITKKYYKLNKNQLINEIKKYKKEISMKPKKWEKVTKEFMLNLKKKNKKYNYKNLKIPSPVFIESVKEEKKITKEISDKATVMFKYLMKKNKKDLHIIANRFYQAEIIEHIPNKKETLLSTIIFIYIAILYKINTLTSNNSFRKFIYDSFDVNFVFGLWGNFFSDIFNLLSDNELQMLRNFM